MPKMIHSGEFCGHTVLPDRLILIGQKLAGNVKIQEFKCDILSNFQTMYALKTKYFKVGSLLLQELSCFLWLLGVGFAQSRVRRRRRSFSEMLGEERALACNHLLGLVASAAVFVVGSLSLLAAQALP